MNVVVDVCELVCVGYVFTTIETFHIGRRISACDRYRRIIAAVSTREWGRSVHSKPKAGTLPCTISSWL